VLHGHETGHKPSGLTSGVKAQERGTQREEAAFPHLSIAASLSRHVHRYSEKAVTELIVTSIVINVSKFKLSNNFMGDNYNSHLKR
jgi:hypothetical protein